MSVTELELQVLRLPPRERPTFLAWVEEHRDELADNGAESNEPHFDEAGLEAAQQREVLRRLAEVEAQPGTLEPFEAADLERMIEEMVHARAQKTSSRQV